MEMQFRIRDKARELFFRYGIRAVTMDEIASLMGISKKTLYQYYQDKDALVDAVVDYEITGDMQKCGTIQGAGKNALEEMILMFGMMEEIFANLNPVVVYELEKYYPASHLKMEQHKNSFFAEIIKTNIKKGIDEELYRKDIQMDILIRMRLESMFMVFDQKIFPKEKYPLLLTSRELLKHFVYGITTSKGNKLFTQYLDKLNHK